MLTERSYLDARDHVEETLGCRGRNWATDGLSLHEVMVVLEVSGWDLEARWRYKRYSYATGRQKIISRWPPAPWAERHLGYKQMHFVAIEADGTVLDTHWRGRLGKKIDDWPELEAVVGLRYTV